MVGGFVLPFVPAPVARYRCPACRGRTVRLANPLEPPPHCPGCGRTLRRLPLLPAGQATALGLAVGALGLAAVPDLLRLLAGQAVRLPLAPQLMARLDPPPDPARQPLKLLERGLLRQLSLADTEWIPRVEYLADGGARYYYRRRPGQPPLSVDQIRAQIDMPPSFEKEQQAVVNLLQTLQSAGIQLEITRPTKPAAAAEWDPARRTLRIDPSVAAQGSLDFARVLNHEAIHVAQSCRGGGLRAAPRLLGIDRSLAPELASQLDSPTYAEANAWERALEAEAYAHQERLGVGEALVSRHCPLKT